MPITENDFQDLLAERSAAAPPAPDRLTAVHRRIARRQLKVRATAAGGVALTLAAVAVAVPLATGDRGSFTARPAATGEPTLPPLYHLGGRLLGSGTVQSPEQGTVTFQFTPTRTRLAVATVNPQHWPSGTPIEVRLNGHVLTTSGRGDDGTRLGNGVFEADASYWSRFGVRPGLPSTVTVRIKGDAADRPVGTLTVAVYERVPVDD